MCHKFSRMIQVRVNSGRVLCTNAFVMIQGNLRLNCKIHVLNQQFSAKLDENVLWQGLVTVVDCIITYLYIINYNL